MNNLNNEDNELFKKINIEIGNKLNEYSPAQLAYAGDAVYELLVRSHIINNHECSVNLMHREAVRYVKAQAQADIVKNLDCVFTEDEKRIIKRGRNAKVTSSPKNAEFMDYRYATGFEALFGYLYLNGEIDRLLELFSLIVENTEQKNNKQRTDI